MAKIHTIANIEIRVHRGDTKKHKAPHFHIAAAGTSAVIAIPSMEVLVSDMTAKKVKKATEWAKENTETLIDEWNQLNPQQPIK